MEEEKETEETTDESGVPEGVVEALEALGEMMSVASSSVRAASRGVILDGPDHILLTEEGRVVGTFKRVKGRGERGQKQTEEE